MAYAPPNTMLDPTNVMGRRIGAWFIDVIIPTAVALIIGWTVFIGSATKVSNVPSDYCTSVRLQTPGAACVTLGTDAYVGTSSDARHAFAVGGLISLVGALNLFVLQGITGAALGKLMFGLRVVRADGSIAGFGWNALRTVLLVVDQFFCALVGLITASVTHPHRRVGDFAAGTYVVSKGAVGIPIAQAMPGSAYPPAWTPPAPAGWGPPPTGGPQTWGTPQPGWGPPPAATPPPSAAPPAWGTPAASPPPAETPATWGAPAASPAPTETPATEPTPAATGEAPGWASPAPVTEPVSPAPQAQVPQAEVPGAQVPQAQVPQTQAPAAQVPAAAPAAREPQWDAQRNAWVYWEAETQRWLQHDPATGQWGPLR
ncbi:MAG TPA: RDD family protein [Acidimicrobiia bacterium]